jgi:hypothetical protein
MVKVDVASVGALSYSICCAYTMCCCHAWRRKRKRKVRGWTHYHGSARATAVGEGLRAWVRCDGDGGGVGARVVVGHRVKRERGGER